MGVSVLKVLVTGGAGYIGSTICSALEERGIVPVVLDSLITGQAAFTANRIFYLGDIGDVRILGRIFSEHPDIVSVIHCAALGVVAESEQHPFEYYCENVSKAAAFVYEVTRLGCRQIVFSSSASVYANVPDLAVSESSPLSPQSPYARSKLMLERILADYAAAYGVEVLSLRYFNPIGADPKFRSGVHVRSPSHVVGKLVDVAKGVLSCFTITGTNWPTRDGSGIRDYVHVWDLARAHVEAIIRFKDIFAANKKIPGAQNAEAAERDDFRIINLGTGSGTTVRELVTAFEKVCGRQIQVREAPPRPGDVAGAFANADLAARLLGWKAELPLENGIADALEWGRRRKAMLGYD